VKVDATRVRDTVTGLTWDFPLNAADTYPNADAKCTSRGMRLPHVSELQTLNVTVAQTATCIAANSYHIDSVAFPDLANASTSAPPRYWSGDPEAGFPGYLYVLYFVPGGGSGTTDRMASQTVAFLCVSGP
jgi:hypothetical protein